MSLHESIRLEISSGYLSEPFSIRELLEDKRRVFLGVQEPGGGKFRVGFDFYAESTISTAIRNYSTNDDGSAPGWNVKQGRAAQYVRVSKGWYRLADSPDHDELYDDTDESDMASTHALLEASSIEERISKFLVQKPFQIFNRRNKKLHPEKPATGISQRLNSYFWPSLSDSFADTKDILDGFIKRAEALLASDFDNGEQLIALFSDICKWGGVRLPSRDAHVISENIKAAGYRSHAKAAAMNSAWTKLYAIFYPDEFAIYDSRVAAALISLAEDALSTDELGQFRAAYPKIGTIGGRGGSRPRASKPGWRNAYGSWPAQLDANALCKKILASVNSDNGTVSLRELEAILFMEGY